MNRFSLALDIPALVDARALDLLDGDDAYPRSILGLRLPKYKQLGYLSSIRYSLERKHKKNPYSWND